MSNGYDFEDFDESALGEEDEAWIRDHRNGQTRWVPGGYGYGSRYPSASRYLAPSRYPVPSRYPAPSRYPTPTRYLAPTRYPSWSQPAYMPGDASTANITKNALFISALATAYQELTKKTVEVGTGANKAQVFVADTSTLALIIKFLAPLYLLLADPRGILNPNSSSMAAGGITLNGILNGVIGGGIVHFALQQRTAGA